jgi:hypothetical protein
MRRASLLVCAIGSTLFLVTGCTLTELFIAGRSDSTGDRVVVGSADMVAVSTKASLQRMGFGSVVITRTSEGIKVISQTKTGAHFYFLLTSERTTQGERTHVSLRWEDGRDDQEHVRIMAEIDKAHKSS